VDLCCTLQNSRPPKIDSLHVPIDPIFSFSLPLVGVGHQRQTAESAVGRALLPRTLIVETRRSVELALLRRCSSQVSPSPASAWGSLIAAIWRVRRSLKLLFQLTPGFNSRQWTVIVRFMRFLSFPADASLGGNIVVLKRAWPNYTMLSAPESSLLSLRALRSSRCVLPQWRLDGSSFC